MARKREEEKKDPLDYVRYDLEYRVSTINGIPVEQWPSFSNISFGTHKVRETRKDPQEVQRVYNEMWDGSGEGPLEGREDHYLKPDSRYSLGPEAKGNHFNSLFFDDIIGEDRQAINRTNPLSGEERREEITYVSYGFGWFKEHDPDPDLTEKVRRLYEERADPPLGWMRITGIQGEPETPLEIQRRLNQSGRLH